MSSGPPSRSAEGPPQTSTGSNGGAPPVGTPQISEVEFSSDTSETGSWSEAQQNIHDDHQDTTTQATESNDQSQGVRLERIHASLAAISEPHGEDDTDERGGTTVQVTDSDHIHIPRNPLTVIARRLTNAITVVAFLAAVALPFLYLPILLFGGLDSTRFTAALLLVGLHVLSLAIGHQYEPRKPAGSD